ncbi:MAG: thioredoxin domain-containing protein [Pseudolysinimonas sp.]|uniref:DsbA family protein n=1 Tax=Pseudolysinimonas sp. TaxID=2680009 RepID=UPI0032676197
MAQERQTKDQRRDEAREIARIEREKRQKSEARNTILIRGGVTVAIVAVIAAVGWGIWIGTRPEGAGPANMASDGILLTGSNGAITPVTTDGVPAGADPTPTDPKKYDVPVHIVTYIDFGCPFCNQFETANSGQIRQLLQDGLGTLEVHPINLLSTSFLGSGYSLRSANAGACVAAYAPDKFLDVSDAFFKQQPAENTAGLTDAEIVTLLASAGASSDKITSCVNNEEFKGWVNASTTRVLSDPALKNPGSGKFGTPTIIVNGVFYQPSNLSDPQEFATFLTKNADFSSGGGATPSPTPTPTPTP